jgi:hypothetical protein
MYGNQRWDPRKCGWCVQMWHLRACRQHGPRACIHGHWRGCMHPEAALKSTCTLQALIQSLPHVIAAYSSRCAAKYFHVLSCLCSAVLPHPC